MQKSILAVLLVIMFLLGANLFRSNEVHAGNKYQYKVIIYTNQETLEKQLNSYTSQGWEFVETVNITGHEWFIVRK